MSRDHDLLAFEERLTAFPVIGSEARWCEAQREEEGVTGFEP